MKALAVALVVVALFLGAVSLLGAAVHDKVPVLPEAAAASRTLTIVVPMCEEDELYVGRGDYEGGRWTRYVCVPRDDIEARP